MIGHVVPAPPVPAPPGLPALRLVRAGRLVREVALRAPATVVGRDPHLLLCLNDLGVSRCHAAFMVRGGQVWVRDLGSTNGVCVNGARIPAERAVPLRGGDKVLIGCTELEYRPALGTPARAPRRAGC